ncbi:Fungalysin/Thermolysin Extracellular metalloproteinase 5 [Phlyctochytrium bullatum]|nr:Fungalysin/Thermolysin Extracellular metalloproteinase 5 [Phlyctochytrium bullatum]
MLLLRSLIALAAIASTATAAPSHHHNGHARHGLAHGHAHAHGDVAAAGASHGHKGPNRPHAGVSFGPDLSHARIHLASASAALAPLPAGSSGKPFAPILLKAVDSETKTVSFKEAVKVAKAFAAEKLANNSKDASRIGLTVTDAYTSDHNGVTHVYLVQTIDGLEVANGVANVHIDAHGRVLSFSSSFHHGEIPSVETAPPAPLVFGNQQRLDRRDRHHKKGKKAASKHHEAQEATVSSLDTNALLSPVDALLRFSDSLSLGIPRAAVLAADAFVPTSPRLLPDRRDPDMVIRLNPTASLHGGSTTKLPASVPAKLKWMQTSTGSLVPVWDLRVDLDDNYFNAHVHAQTGEVVSNVDWVSDASYKVYPMGTNDPEEGDRVLVEDPEHPAASPSGWHKGVNPSSGAPVNWTVTSGNNVYAQENPSGGYEWKKNHRPQGTSDLVFDFPVDFTKDPVTYKDAAITNLFYWNNAIHDLFYVYGFTEKAGNFQEENFGRGGEGGDGVIANAQDGSGYNNANFATPPDGERGRMRMYVWDSTDPMRDGDLEGGIVMHEYAHGISIRLTGGPSNSGCLGWGEAGGMGEGWGDFFATILRTDESTPRNATFGMGEYANGGNGIRKYKYSTSKKVNPSTYALVKKPQYWGVHAKGEVWAEILYEVYWDLVDELGYNPDWYDTPLAKTLSKTYPAPAVPAGHYRDYRTGTIRTKPPRFATDEPAVVPDANGTKKWTRGGNILALQIVVDGLKLQPCYPNFVDARVAILQAEEALTGGKYACLIWKAFARRGLGSGARGGGDEDYSVPKKCEDDDDEEDDEEL